MDKNWLKPHMEFFEHAVNFGEYKFDSVLRAIIPDFRDPNDPSDSSPIACAISDKDVEMRKLFISIFMFLRHKYIDDKDDPSMGYTLYEIFNNIGVDGNTISKRKKVQLIQTLRNHHRIVETLGVFGYRSYYPANSAKEFLYVIKMREAIGIRGASLAEVRIDLPNIHQYIKELRGKLVVIKGKIYLKNALTSIKPSIYPAFKKLQELAKGLDGEEKGAGGDHISISPILNQGFATHLGKMKKLNFL